MEFFLILLLILGGAAVAVGVYALVSTDSGRTNTYLPPDLPAQRLPPVQPTPAPLPPPPSVRSPPLTRRRPQQGKFHIKAVNRYVSEAQPFRVAPKPGSNGLAGSRKRVNFDAICNRTGMPVRECRCDDCRTLREQHGIG
jgi:hypothetical protein